MKHMATGRVGGFKPASYLSPFWIKEQEHEDSNVPDFNNMKCN